MPKVTVMICAYNAQDYIKPCIDSVLVQSYNDFELLVVDDGSTDNTLNILNQYTDKRIRIISKEHNYIDSLNKGLEEAKGEYIARMDADDIMHPDRLQVQVAVMDSEPEIGICACWAKPFGDGLFPSKNWDVSPFCGLIEHPLVNFIRGNFIYHPAVMMRRQCLQNLRLKYSTDYPYAEDYKLWVEMAQKKVVFLLVSQPLLYYRVSKQQISNSHKKEQHKTTQKIQLEVIRTLIGDNKQKDALEIILDKMIEVEKSAETPLIIPYFYEYFRREFRC